MASMNKAILVGNLTRDPELRYSTSGQPFVKFGLAMNRKYKVGDEIKEEVDFIDILVWGKQAEACSEYLAKGRQVLVEGRISQNNWVATDGSKRSKHEVVAERVHFLGSSASSTQSKGSSSFQDKSDDENLDDMTDDEVPF